MDDFAFPSADTEISSESAVLDDFAFPADSEISSESAELDDFAFPADTEISSESAELDDFAFPSADTEETSESAELEDSAFSVADSELPNFDDFDIDSEESFEMEDNAPFTFDSLPEFDEIPELKDNSTDFSDDFAAMDFELPEIDESKYEFAASNEGGDPLFDSLYEENYKETEKSQKKTTIPVVICVICALICLGVLGIILWLTKPNLFGTKDAEPTVTIPVENVETELPVLEKEDLTSAKENEIVITPEPVVPEIPEPKVEVAPAKVIYRIKWGDTLWDLAESYYQNPWLYPKIAKANNIKNPDVIISGTDIEIPPLN
ncbi:MAG: LysM peptidoglycan-binding domain-containing protein [Spirochaetaceae bacterium]|nr:LysM peptidoglycan-binding domain-containing protein [Spirochaetaceae bacterium]